MIAARTLTDGGQQPVDVARTVADFLGAATTNLWCIRSGIPGTARVSTVSCSMSSGAAFGGGGTGIGARKSALYSSRTATPFAFAASIAPRTIFSVSGPSLRS